MTRKKSLGSKLAIFLMVLAVVFSYSVMPMNQAYAASKPAKVKISAAKATSTSTVKLTWKKAKNAKKYQVYRATKKTGKYKKIKTVKKVNFVNKKLKAGTTYYYKVRAINGSAKGKFSAIKAVTTFPEAEDRQVFVDADYVKALKDSKKSNVVIAQVSWGALDDPYADIPDYKIPGAIHINTDDFESNMQDGGFEYWDIRGFNNDYKELIDVLGKYGITKDTELVCYGASGTDSAPTRVAFAALMAGVKNVRVLDGGVQTYGDKYSLSTEFATPKAKSFGRTTVAHPEYVISTDDMLKKVKEDDNFKLVSIRSYDEFVGTNSGYAYIDKAGEPVGAIWGHDTDDGSYFKDGKTVDTDVINDYLKPYSASTKNELAFYCGTGWRATIPFLICYEEGIDNMKLWDDGWYVYSGAYADKWNGGDENYDAVNDHPVQIGDPAKGDVVKTTVGALEPKYNKLRGISAKEEVVAAKGEGTLDSNFVVMPDGKPNVLNNVKFSSSDESVATVDAEGKVTVVDASKTKQVTITCESNSTCGDGPCHSASYTLVVNGEVKETAPSFGKEKERKMITKIDMTDTTRYPKGKVVEVWVPIAQTDEVNGYQTADEDIVIDAPKAAVAEVTFEKEHNNKMVYLKWDKNTNPADRTATISYKVSRKEVIRTDLVEDETAGFPDDALATLNEESRFVKVKAPIVQKYAARATKGKTGTLEKARGIYDWVTKNLARIDNGEKIGKYYTFDVEGCGYGDTVKILEDYEAFGIAGGHCTDINSTFVALCRAAGVPAREMFGVRLNDDATGGQHCWTEFYLPGTGWVFADPGDALKAVKPTFADKVIDKDAWDEAKASEKFAESKEYFWGSVDENRVVVSNGRDIVLEPAQAADPRNTFGYPYAEVDGKTDPENSYRNVDAQGKYIDCTVASAFKYTIKCSNSYYDMTPEEWEAVGVKVEDLDFENDFFLNVRSKEAYDEKHIAGAVNVPVGREPAEKDSDEAKALDKAFEDAAGKRIVIVCNSGQGLAKSAMEYYLKSGKDMSNVTYLIGGATNYPNMDPANLEFGVDYNYIIAEDLVKDIQSGNPEYKVIDVRLSGEDNTGYLGTFEDAHIVTAVSAPVHDADNKPLDWTVGVENLKAAGVSAEGDQKYVIVCYYGGELAQRAFKLAYNNMGVSADRLIILEGGMWAMDPEWSFMADNPYEAPELFAKVATSNDGVTYNGVTADQLKADLAGHKIYKVVDVRKADDYDAGHIDTAVSAPVKTGDAAVDAANIKAVADQYGKGAVYCLICYSGNAYADAAQSLLLENGIPEGNIVRLIGGQNGWTE